ncbi:MULTISPECIES: hypothetical protein [Streptococcus]|uniref:Uncharacterized protein n=1 Tax=Streptococcus caledonicus TaxID=2614158 RepID=A0ABW0U9E3_9STRE|nr:hypothetical protein [Streptococcus sp. S784/96/1]
MNETQYIKELFNRYIVSAEMDVNKPGKQLTAHTKRLGIELRQEMIAFEKNHSIC